MGNMKLKLIIDNHKQEKFAVQLEQKVDNLMKEYEILRKSHEEKNRLLIRNHDNEIKKERSMISGVTMKVQTLEGEIKKAREFYARKMKDNDKKVEEAEKARLDQIQLVINKEGIIRDLKESVLNKDNVIKDLKESVSKLENGKVNEIGLIARQKVIEAQKLEINKLTTEKKKLEKELKDWEKQCTIFWERDPKSIFKSEKDYTKEDKNIFIEKLEKNAERAEIRN